jgi:hypothetical protein
MNHRDVEYRLEQLADDSWRWIIFPPNKRGAQVVSEQRYASRDDADQACIDEIDRALAETST